MKGQIMREALLGIALIVLWLSPTQAREFGRHSWRHPHKDSAAETDRSPLQHPEQTTAAVKNKCHGDQCTRCKSGSCVLAEKDSAHNQDAYHHEAVSNAAQDEKQQATEAQGALPFLHDLREHRRARVEERWNTRDNRRERRRRTCQANASSKEQNDPKGAPPQSHAQQGHGTKSSGLYEQAQHQKCSCSNSHRVKRASTKAPNVSVLDQTYT